MKVVINDCFGGFSISLEAARFMAERGNDVAREEVSDYDEKMADPSKRDEWDDKWGVRWYGYGPYDRADPALIEAVETLGDAASGGFASLKIVEIPDGTDYEIEEYDGLEHIAERHRTWR